jgi:hypothetical protein
MHPPGQSCPLLGITEQTFCRWKRCYFGLEAGQLAGARIPYAGLRENSAAIWSNSGSNGWRNGSTKNPECRDEEGAYATCESWKPEADSK